ncbi:MAG: histidine kinase, partial [Ferruginibacter sp.]
HYDKTKKIFTTTGLPPSPYGNSSGIAAFVPDQQNILWLATEGGLLMYNVLTGKATSFYNNSTEEGSMPIYSNRLRCMIQGSDGKLWIGSADGLWTFDKATHVFKKIIHKNNDRWYHPLCMCVYEDHEHNIWAGFWNVGLKKFDTHNGQLSDYGEPLAHAYTISCINEVKQSNGNYILWLSGKLFAFDENTKSYFNFQQPLTEKDPLNVSPVLQSADGWVWLASSNGLYIYNPQRQVFDHQVFTQELTSQAVNFYNYKGGLLIGAQDKGFLQWKTIDGKLIKDYSVLANAQTSTAMLSMIEEKPDDFWMGTSDGILHYNFTTGEKKWFVHNEKDSTTIPKNFIANLFIDSKNNLWVFPWRDGIWQMDRLTGKCTKLIDGFGTEGGKIKKLLISDAAEDMNGNIWMTDLDEGVVLYNAATKKFSKPFQQQLGDRYSSSNIFIRGRFVYSRISTGLIRWNIDSTSFERFNLPNEMNKGLTDMYPDQKGNWWFAAMNGLILFNEKEKTFKRFTTADGLLRNDINGNLFCTADGKMIIGATTYFSVFDPEQLIRTSFNDKNVLLTGFMVNNKNVNWDSSRSVSLNYNENNILIRWALPDYGNPLHNLYYIKLNGIDADWRYIGNTGDVQYANLSPGKYTVQLKAATANGNPSRNIITVKFTILSPFWKTWWFLLLISLIIALLIYQLVSRRIKKLKREAALKQQLSELEMKALRAQMNPHFIFNSLNSIQECIVSKDTDAAYTYLSQFSKLVRRVLENSGKATVTLKEELELMQWYLSLEQLRFTDEFKFSIENNYSNPQVEIPSMIIQPFIENALWHGLAHKRGEKILRLEVEDENNGIKISITDNGIGRKAASVLSRRPDKQSMGLSITKERLRNYSAASSVEINDLMDENGGATGTKVIIHLPYN